MTAEKHNAWQNFSREQKTKWYDLHTLPEKVQKKLENFSNMPKFIRADLGKSKFKSFGWHIGSIEAQGGQSYVLVPSDDKGYGYGVCSNP